MMRNRARRTIAAVVPTMVYGLLALSISGDAHSWDYKGSLLNKGSYGSENWPVVAAESDTLAAAIEPSFREFAGNCKIIPLNTLGSPSYIPPNMRNKEVLPLNQKVFAIPRESVNRVFAFVFSEQQLAELKTISRIDPENFTPLLNDSTSLSGVVNQVFVPTPRPGSSALVYRNSCTSYVKAVADANLKIPLASVEAAIDSDVKQNAQVVLVTGAFISPVWSNLEKRDVETHLGFWRLHTAAKEERSGFYLKGFEGAVLIRATSATFESGASIKARADVPISLVNSSSAFDIGTNQSSSITEESYLTIVYVPESGDLKKLFGPIPTVAAIQEVISKIPRDFIPSASALAEQKPYSHKHAIRALPRRYCDQEQWHMEWITGASYFEGATYTVAYDPVLEACTFQFSGVPNSTATATLKPINMSYAFETARSLPSKGQQPTRLSILLSADRLSVVGDPTIRPLMQTIPARPNLSQDFKKVESLEWTMPLDIYEGENPIDFTRAAEIEVTSATKLDCRGVDKPVTHTTALDARNKRVNVTFGHDTGQLEVTKMGATSVCKLEGKVVLPVQGGRVTRNFAASFAWPLSP